MIKRKTIAFFSGGSDEEYNGKIVNGIHEECINSDINLMGFGSLMNKQPEWFGEVLSDIVKRGENQCFDLVDFSSLDGAIILGDLFVEKSIQAKLAAKCVANNVPTVVIDGEEPGCYSIVYDDGKGMENMLRHVIEHHGARRINFISGYKKNRQSEERVEAYKKVLEENGIPFEEGRVGYGQFGGRTPVVMDEFLSSGLEFPDAIVCANDTMAIEAVGYLINIGKSVPEDVIVTGFDGIMQGQTYYPAITSVRRAIYEAGQEAVRIIQKCWNNEEVPKTTYMESIIIKNQSCGCRKCGRADVGQFFNCQNELLYRYQRFNYDHVNLSNDLSKAENFEDIMKGIYNNAYLFDVQNMYFCLNDKLIKPPEEITVDEEMENGFSYTEIMTAYYFDDKGNVHTERFPLWKMVPEACASNTGRHFTYFYPMYYQDKTLGYAIVKLDEYDRNSMLLYTLLRTFSNALGMFCMRKEMVELAHKLEYMYVRDPLTSLYNRRGLLKYGNKLLEESHDTGKFVFGIGIDLDELKVINDTYGHEEGDNAILRVSNAVKYAGKGHEICSRTGGDEFFILGLSEDKSEGEKIVNRIYMYLKEYNNSGKKSYNVDCSCGIYVAPADKVQSFETVMKFADQRMYTIKMNKKAIK